MKLTTFFILTTLVFATSCKKTVENRITGKHEMEKAYRNGADWTGFFNAIFQNWKMELKNNGDFIETYGNTTTTGTWKVLENGKRLRLTETGGLIRPYIILESSKTSLELEEKDGDGNTNRYVLRKI